VKGKGVVACRRVCRVDVLCSGDGGMVLSLEIEDYPGDKGQIMGMNPRRISGLMRQHLQQQSPVLDSDGPKLTARIDSRDPPQRPTLTGFGCSALTTYVLVIVLVSSTIRKCFAPDLLSLEILQSAGSDRPRCRRCSW
jgi:hypothetical protein